MSPRTNKQKYLGTLVKFRPSFSSGLHLFAFGFTFWKSATVSVSIGFHFGNVDNSSSTAVITFVKLFNHSILGLISQPPPTHARKFFYKTKITFVQLSKSVRPILRKDQCFWCVVCGPIYRSNQLFLGLI